MEFVGSNARPGMWVALLCTMLLVGTALLAQTTMPQAQQSQQQQVPQAQQNQQQPNAHQPLGSSISDQERITREARHELLMLPYYTLFDYLGYKVEGNKVTLVGAVTNPTLKSDAENAVKKIEGVQSVDNRIDVLPPSPQDDRIRREVYRSIYEYDGLSRYAWGALPSIHIIVKNGHVSLVGDVDSEADKNMAEMRAKSVPGVFSVEDNLAVSRAAEK